MSTFKLPDLGEGLAEAEILEWHVKAGDQVRVDQPMVSVETAKAVVEVPAPFSGMVTALHGAVGDIVPDRRAAHRFRFGHRGRQHAAHQRGRIRRVGAPSEARSAATARPAAARCRRRARWRDAWSSISAPSKAAAPADSSRSTMCWRPRNSDATIDERARRRSTRRSRRLCAIRPCPAGATA